MNLYSPHFHDKDINPLFDFVCDCLLSAPSVDTGHWQGKKNTPMSQTRELQNCVFEIPIAATPGAWASFMRPNLPWAEDHFKERVSGIPHNPPPSHLYWPFNQAANKDHMDGEVFSHTYPERLWPKRAGAWASNGPIGIRYPAGDLGDLITLLIKEPFTRQAFAPLWYPEDLTAANRGQRVPCTLGYHLMLRRNQLDCFYPMRSLDWLRYGQDDLYMAGRLCQWVIDQCKARLVDEDSHIWHEVTPGTLTMHVVSVHCFEGDISLIKHRLSKKQKVTA